MSNTQGPFGFRMLRRIDGAAPNYQHNAYSIAYNNGNKIAIGDPVQLLASGFIDILAPGTTNILGIFLGCKYIDPTLQRTVWGAWPAPGTLASTALVDAQVSDDPNMIFEAQVGGSSSVGLVAADVGNNINFAGQGVPNTWGGSVAYLDQTTLSPSTATRPFRIVGLSEKIGNDNLSAYNIANVKLNFAQLTNTTGV